MNLAKGNFRFAPLMYLEVALGNIDKMPQSTFDEIIEKYVEMNVAHTFRAGNGRSTRIWLDCILKKELHQGIDSGRVDKSVFFFVLVFFFILFFVRNKWQKCRSSHTLFIF